MESSQNLSVPGNTIEINYYVCFPNINVSNLVFL